jgi:hypothetical protein
VKDVTRARGPGPFNLSARADNPTADWQSTFNLQPHGDCRCVPPTGRQAGEQRILRRYVVEVEGLWVEMLSEGFDLRFVKRMRSAGEALAWVKVFEKEALIPAALVYLCHPRASFLLFPKHWLINANLC